MTKEISEIAFLLEGMMAEQRQIIGDILWLYGFSKIHQRYSIHLLLKLILPALQHRQYLLHYQNQRPVAYCNWAFLNKEILNLMLRGNYILLPEQWQIGKLSFHTISFFRVR